MDPDSGEDVVTDSPDAEVDEMPEETDPHLLLYNLLFEEIQSRISHHYQSLLTGLSIIGVIIAYALLTGELVFLAVVPVVIGLLIVQSIRHLNSILFSARHLNRIEGAYADEHDLFVWERQYGMTGTKRSVERWGVNWTVVPAGIVMVFAAMGYLGSMYVAYVVWPPDGVDILRVGLSRGGLLLIYMLITALICLAGYSHYLHRETLTSSEG